MAVRHLGIGPIWESYEKHLRAQSKDRVKHFPGQHLTTIWRYDPRTFRNYSEKLCTGFPLYGNPTTAEYVAAYCAANNLTMEQR